MGADTTCDKQEISCSAIVDALTEVQKSIAELFCNHKETIAHPPTERIISENKRGN